MATDQDTLSLSLPFIPLSLKIPKPVDLALDPYLVDHIRVALRYLSIVAIPLIFTYVATWLSFTIQHWSKKDVKIPPTIPYVIPFVGSTCSFVFDTYNFVSLSTWKLGKQTPFRLDVLSSTLYFVQGAENIALLLKKSSTISGLEIQYFCLAKLFGMPAKALKMYALDTSGLLAEPHADSDVAPHNRVDYLTHVSMVKMLSGDGLRRFYKRWATGFLERLQSLDIGEEWVQMADLVSFWDENFSPAVTEAITGPILRRVNPNFIHDLYRYDHAIPDLSRGLPRWMIPKAYAVRDSLLRDIKEWHAIARAQFRESDIGDDADADPWWGSEFIRGRQKIFAGIDNFDYDAYASSDLGFIWVAITNFIPTALWSILEIFKDPVLLARVRSELNATFDSAALSDVAFDSDKLRELPLLHSVYAEVLRLRIWAYVPRYTARADLEINGWRFPKNSFILASTVPAHQDPTFWNTRDGAHPVHKFWADRFLAYPNDPQSGPQRKTGPTPRKPVRDASESTTGAGPSRFTTLGTTGSWFPYGGGPRVCPGRFFAKRAIITASAIMATMFDIEILADEKALGMDLRYYGLGGQHPVGEVPFKIRRRKM